MANEAASQFVGGLDFSPSAIAVDTSGNTYVFGQRTFPQNGKNTTDIQLFKFNPQFEQVFQRSYGGSSYDSPSAMVMGGDGNLYLTGGTSSADFPTMNPVQSTLQGTGDAFLMKLSQDGEILFSTLYGGSGADGGSKIVVDGDGNAYIAGTTKSPDFPFTQGAYLPQVDTSGGGGAGLPSNLFVMKIDTTSATVVYAAGFPGASVISLYSIGLAAGGDLFVLLSPTSGSSQDGSEMQVFGRLRADGSTLVSQTNLDLSAGSFHSMVVGKDGNPVLSGGKLVILDAATNEEISRVNLANGFAYLGAVDPEGDLFVYGTGSHFTTTPGGFSSGGNFVLELTPDGTTTLFGSAMPNQSSDTGLAVDSTGYIHVLGSTALMSRILPDENTSAMQGIPRILGIANAALNEVSPKVAPGEIMSLYGPSLGTDQAMFTQVGSDGLVETTLGGVEVRFNGTAGPLLYTGPTQINVTAPFDLGSGSSVLVEVVKDGTTWASITMDPVAADPGAFGLGEGSPVLNQDYTVNSPKNPAKPGTIGIFYMTGAGQMMGASYQDGQIFDPTTPIADLPTPKLPVVLDPQPYLQQQQLEILYAGQAPGMLAGVLQVNFRIPERSQILAGLDFLPQTIGLKVGAAQGISPGIPMSIWIAPSGQ